MIKLALAATTALSIAVFAPMDAAEAGKRGRIIGGIAIGGAVACSLSKRCRKGVKKLFGKKSRKRSGRKYRARTKGRPTTRTRSTASSAPRRAAHYDDVTLSGESRRLVQRGLMAYGLYSGAIDGAFGAGTRSAIRSYQLREKHRVTGYLTATEADELIFASPEVASLSTTDPRRFAYEVSDTTMSRDELRRLQELLASMGYAVGKPDGRMGRKTRAGIASYKKDRSIPGSSFATGRLLVYMESTGTSGGSPVTLSAGLTPPGSSAVPATMAAVAATGGAVVAGQEASSLKVEVLTAEPVTLDEGVATAKVEKLDVRALKLLGIEIGMAIEKGAELAKTGAKAPTEMAVSGEAVGRHPVLDKASHFVRSDANRKDHVLIVSDDDDEGGLLVNGVFRRMDMPKGWDAPKLVSMLEAQFGRSIRSGDDLIWMTDRTSADYIEGAGAELSVCGDVRVNGWANGVSDGWTGEAGPKVVVKTVPARRCGTVVRATIGSGVVSMGLWSADQLMDAPSATSASDGEVAVRF